MSTVVLLVLTGLGLAALYFLIATGLSLAALGGAMYALIVGGASPHLASADRTLSLIVMAVLGGAGTRWACSCSPSISRRAAWRP